MKFLYTAIFIISILISKPSFASCAMSNESEALDYKALQSNMMVAALSCNQQQNYNKLIKKYKNDFVESGKDIKAYFKRIYGPEYKTEMNKFVTSLANKATKRSMKIDSQTYCKEMSSMFKELLKLENEMLAEFIEDKNLPSLHGVNSCS